MSFNQSNLPPGVSQNDIDGPQQTEAEAREQKDERNEARWEIYKNERE